MTDLLDKARALEEQLRADDAAMTPGPWSEPAGARLRGAIDALVDGQLRQVAQASAEAPAARQAPAPLFQPPDFAARELANNATGIARTRNALPAIADTLRDLSGQVEQMRTQRDEAVADGVLSQRVCDIENDRAQLTTERDAALARVRELEAEVARLGQRVRDQDEELTAHAERGHRQLMEAMASHRARKP